MHELSLCESVLALVEKKVAEEKGARIVKITLAVGEYSGACRESMAFCFPLVAKGTVAETAALEFQNAPGRDLRVVSFDVE